MASIVFLLANPHSWASGKDGRLSKMAHTKDLRERQRWLYAFGNYY